MMEAMCEVCEYAPATIEYKYIDEDGDVYYTYRCENHPEHDLTYAEVR